MVIITLLGPWSLKASIGRVRCERILELPFLPPGLSVASRIGVSLSRRPALRSALAAMAFDPGAGAGAADIIAGS